MSVTARALSPPQVRRLAEERIARWSAALRTAGQRVTLTLAGSVGCGHYQAPKPRWQSLNPACPPRLERLVEVDVRALWPPGTDVASGQVRAAMAVATGADPAGLPRTYQRWGRATVTLLLYAYDEVTHGVGVEWELCVTARPFLEVAALWRALFTREEVAYQGGVRELLRRQSPERLDQVKDEQCAEARWRVVAACARPGDRAVPQRLRALCAKMLADPELSSLLQPHVDAWLAGGYDEHGLLRPVDGPPGSLLPALSGDFDRPAQPPSPPDWVARAREDERKLRAKASS